MYRIFAKTILSAYSSLGFVADKIDVLVRRRVAAGYSGTDCVCTSAQKQIEEIVLLMNKKANLINLKLLADEVLACMEDKSGNLLKLKYIQKTKVQDIMDQMQVSQRTFFRRLDKAEESFAKKCFARGYDQKWFEENYFDQSWIKDLYQHFYQKQNTK